MLRKLEDKLMETGITRLDRILAIGMYILYMTWFATRMFDWLPPLDPGDAGFLYSDIVNALIAMTGLVLALRHHFWLERVAVQVLSITTLLETLTLTVFMLCFNVPFFPRNLLLGVVFSFYFTMRSFGLSVRILRTRASLELRLSDPQEY